MAENLIENRVCSACDAPVRPQALFCYNCGSAVAPEITENEPDLATGKISFPAETGDENNAETKTNTDGNHDQPVEKPSGELTGNKTEQKSPASPSETKLKSAASLRRGARVAPQKKTVEIIWEEPDNAPNIWFLVAAFVLALFVVGILLAMLYIR